MRYRKERKDPRVVGGRYLCGYWGFEYTVLAIDGIRITERQETVSKTHKQEDVGEVLTHCTAWDWDRDRVLAGA